MPDSIGGLLLGRYRVVGRLGGGRTGVVYLARTEGAGGFARPVVVKRIHPQLVGNPDSVRLFIREAHILSNLQHPSLVGVVDFGEDETGYLMVLDYVHGHDLGLWNRLLRQSGKHLPEPVAVHLVLQVLDTLHYAHTLRLPDGNRLQVVHGDVSLANILVDTEGMVRLADFGLASINTPNSETSLRVDGVSAEKLVYLAPEVLRGEVPSPQSDIYSAAVVLAELLSGSKSSPIDKGSEPPQPELSFSSAALLLEHLPPTPNGIAPIISRGLELDPSDRFSSAATFADALRSLPGCSNVDVGVQLAEQAHLDFNGPLFLGTDIQPLHEREKAWRGEDSGDGPLRSSLPAPRLSKRLSELAEEELTSTGTLNAPYEGPKALPIDGRESSPLARLRAWLGLNHP